VQKNHISNNDFNDFKLPCCPDSFLVKIVLPIEKTVL
jgi:hypothetical protein